MYSVQNLRARVLSGTQQLEYEKMGGKARKRNGGGGGGGLISGYKRFNIHRIFHERTSQGVNRVNYREKETSHQRISSHLFSKLSTF